MNSDRKDCRICRELSDNEHADRTQGETLPPAVYETVEIGDGVRKCPVCGTYYRFWHVYDYSPFGSDDDDYLQRLDREKTIDLLLHVRNLTDTVIGELEQLGIKDAYAKIMERLAQELESKDKQHNNEQHYAVLTLVDHFFATNPAKLDDLLEHPDSVIRSKTLYFLMHKNANMVSAYVKRLADPVGDVRNHAGWALRFIAEHGRDISAAVPVLINVLTGDPEIDVRRQAADALGAAALQGADISAAVPALTAALGGGYWLTCAAAHTLGKAASKGTDISSAVSSLCRVRDKASNVERPLKEAAIEALGKFEAQSQGEKPGNI
jgi:hypothetical protein